MRDWEGMVRCGMDGWMDEAVVVVPLTGRVLTWMNGVDGMKRCLFNRSTKFQHEHRCACEAGPHTTCVRNCIHIYLRSHGVTRSWGLE